MLAEQVSLHEWNAFKLVVIDGFDECMLWLAEERLVHVFHLVLEIWQCMFIVGEMACMAALLLG